VTPQEVLAKVFEAGGQIIPDPDRPRLLVPHDLRHLVAEHRAALRELVLRQQIGPPTTPIPALRRALRVYYALIPRDDPRTLQEARMLLSEIRRLWDDTGPAFAEVVEREEARAYYRETGRCPYCGEIAVFHDPDRGGEPA
jgi:hypothetical protein